MEYLWTPWRYQYVTQATPTQPCVFCEVLKRNDDAATFVLFRGRHNFLLLNHYPYTSGHVMVAPFEHVADLDHASTEALREMMELAQRFQRALAAVYHPEGYNLGMNLGAVAGAGVAGHIHLHILPRWAGDTSFMTTVGEARLEPEELAATYAKLKPHFQS